MIGLQCIGLLRIKHLFGSWWIWYYNIKFFFHLVAWPKAFRTKSYVYSWVLKKGGQRLLTPLFYCFFLKRKNSVFFYKKRGSTITLVISGGYAFFLLGMRFLKSFTFTSLVMGCFFLKCFSFVLCVTKILIYFFFDRVPGSELGGTRRPGIGLSE